ncbi:MAG: hypothetical protein IPP77_07060 [Bacteroidetes bacterium]|nr:hypothetical protein [Bacteroidota bacterium]
MDNRKEVEYKIWRKMNLNWIKKGGLFVFLFFLIKGIGWLVVIGLLAAGLLNEESFEKIKEAIPLF